MNTEQKEAIERALRKCRTAAEQVQRIADALGNAAKAKARQERFDDLIPKH